MVLPDEIPFPAGGQGYPYNEMGAPLFAHTSAIYLEYKGSRVFKPDVARSLIAELEASLLDIEATSRFDTPGQREEVVGIYLDAIAWLHRRLDGR